MFTANDIIILKKILIFIKCLPLPDMRDKKWSGFKCLPLPDMRDKNGRGSNGFKALSTDRALILLKCAGS